MVFVKNSQQYATWFLQTSNFEYNRKERNMKAAAIFSDNMVLQCDKQVCVFGTGKENEKIQILIDQIDVTTTVKNGKWKVNLPAHQWGGPFVMCLKGEDAILEFHNVMYGEVWFAGGQSNMELELQNADFGEKELSEADYKDIRYYNVIKTPYIDENVIQKEETQSWHMCMDGDFRDMSGVAYFFAKKTYEMLKIPIGIVDCYQGGTSISCWMSEENLSALPEGKPYLDAYEKVICNQSEEEYEKAFADYNKCLDAYNQRVAALKEKNPDIKMEEINEKAGDYPWPPPMGRKSLYRPCGLYETMICRIAPYTVRGILYYQGEEDAEKTNAYDRLLVQLITQFRKDWEDGELPFIIVQLPMFIAKNQEENETWPRIRHAQEYTHKLVPYTGLVVLLDLGEFDNIHPTDKKTPGERIALQVLERVYKLPVKGSAMFFRLAKPEKNGICLSFTNTYGNIRIMDNHLLDIRDAEVFGEPVGFEISDDGNEWYGARAYINGENIYVWKDGMEHPAYVRYGYFNYGKVNVYNGAGLPLAPFLEDI
ncbi:MAG: sialate O-acetylesterase [Lachnospiraceae bacterium]